MLNTSQLLLRYLHADDSLGISRHTGLDGIAGSTLGLHSCRMVPYRDAIAHRLLGSIVGRRRRIE